MKARVTVRSSAPSRPVVASARNAASTKATTYKPAAALRSFSKFASQSTTTKTAAPKFTAQKSVTKSFTSVRTPKLFSAPRFISLDASEFNVKTDNVFFQNDNQGLERRETERDMTGNRELGYGGGERDSSAPAPGDSSAVNSPRVYVGNVPYKATNDQIKEFFTSKGLTVESIRMAQDPTGRARGWGIVQLADEEQAKQAVETLDHTTLLDRQILVRADRNRGSRSDRGDGENGGERRPRRTYSFEGGRDGQQRGEGFGGRSEGREGGYGGSRGFRQRGGDRAQRDFGGERDQGGLGGDREGFGRGGYNTNVENKSNDHQQNEMGIPKMG